MNGEVDKKTHSKGFANPWEEEGVWLKGNIHTHSVNSDGTKTPDEIIKLYSEAGYDFLSITDHGVVTETPETDELLLIPGVEYCVGRTSVGTYYHLLTTGIDKTPPFQDFDRDMDPQTILDYYKENGGLAILAHPYWSGLKHRDIMKLTNLDGVEIYNTTCEYERGLGYSGSHIDSMIAEGLRPLIYAVDDHHGAERPYMPLDACGAWVMVKVKEPTREAIIDSLRKGLFYSSIGPTIHNLSIDHSKGITIWTSPAKSITYLSMPANGRKLLAEDKPLEKAYFKMQEGMKYIRIEVTDDKGRTAWTNPIYP
jgi:hypothetical protein